MKELFGFTSDGAKVGLYTLTNAAAGRFSLDGTTFQLTTNDDGNHLHGGLKGFDKVIWEATERECGDGHALDLKYISPDGEEGYPGTLTVGVTYTLTNENELKIDYAAKTDKSTIVNLTHHSYFNLRDAGTSNILEHRGPAFAWRRNITRTRRIIPGSHQRF